MSSDRAPAPAGFTHRFDDVDGVRLHHVDGGAGDDVLVLLAGFPESWFAWRDVMARLARGRRVVAVDLPGQGDSDIPDHGYDTANVAARVHTLLRGLGHDRYDLAAHDIGAWVAFPLALRFGDAVRRLALLDAGIPGLTLPEAVPTKAATAWRTWHFAFHAVADLPEQLIGGRERVYLEWFLRRKSVNVAAHHGGALAEYTRVLERPGALRAALAFYREAERSADQNRRLLERGKLRMPVLALGADQGSIPDMAAALRPHAPDLRGTVIADCGHFQPEERPDTVAEALAGFFGVEGGAPT